MRNSSEQKVDTNSLDLALEVSPLGSSIRDIRELSLDEITHLCCGFGDYRNEFADWLICFR